MSKKSRESNIIKEATTWSWVTFLYRFSEKTVQGVVGAVGALGRHHPYFAPSFWRVDRVHAWWHDNRVAWKCSLDSMRAAYRRKGPLIDFQEETTLEHPKLLSRA